MKRLSASPDVHRGKALRAFPLVLLLLLPGAGAAAQAVAAGSPQPAWPGSHFDYAAFTRLDVPSPPRPLIYQANGFMALQELGFGSQRMIVPVAGPAAPTNTSDRLSALEIEAPVFTGSSGRTYLFDSSPAHRSMTYFADRTVYRADFNNGPEVQLTVYPVFGESAAVLRVRVVRSDGPLRVVLTIRPDGFNVVSDHDAQGVSYGSPQWPYRAILDSRPRASFQQGQFQWILHSGDEAALLIALGGTEPEAAATLLKIRSSPDLFDRETHRLWNNYLASAPLVIPTAPVSFTVGTTGDRESIDPRQLVRSELWFWRGVLNTTCRSRYLPATPIMIADWNVFMGMWSNDGIAEAIALASTNQSALARAAILNWFRYSVNAQGDGTSAWTIFPSGRNTFAATGPERNTQGVPVQASLVGEYVRLTGDKSILQARPGGVAGNRTVWQALLAYQHNLLAVRDPSHDGLIEWLHTYETGWDDKDSPFIDLHGDPTAAINEQVFQLWSLREMAWLARLQGDDPSPWEQKFTRTLAIVRTRLWDPATRRYWDLDEKTGDLWTRGENLDAYYLLCFENDPRRIAAMLQRLNDPKKFNGPLLPTLAFDTPHWGGYWRGPAWPRIFGYVGMGLARSGHAQEGFTWLARAIDSNLGPLLPENVDPRLYPPRDHAIGSVRIMGYDALDTLIFPDVAGLRTWGGDDLAVVPDASADELYIRNQEWMGDRYDAVLDPNQPTRIWRNGRALPALAPHRIWRAEQAGGTVVFRPVPEPYAGSPSSH
ncbi:MAG TPA: hypothetical protein VMD25_10495 [Acidobacteriaceae bacterium]|nr:hypothetical protein [Acidobacteriaceae bacterium]